MNYPADEIVQEFGYQLILQNIEFPIAGDVEKKSIEKLRSSYYELLPKINVNSETAKREFMIAPLLHEIIRKIDVKLNIEYPLDIDDRLSGFAVDIDDRLSGFADYLLRSHHKLLIIEAKRGDLDRGFNQLAAELIALDKYEEPELSDTLYGAITIGEIWRFALLHREKKHIVKDIHIFRFPEDTEQIFGIITGILT